MSNSYIGKIVSDRYEIISLIGIGGMSNVYKAIDKKSGQTVAIKFMKPELFDNEELVRRFKNESKAISLLNHPNIIKVFDVNIKPNEKYIVVEYIDGITLKEYIDNRKVLTVQETLRFTQTILEAIGYAHENGIIHRDMKPQNIMILRDGSIRIMDFGIARLSTANQHTVTDKAIGSVHYISPEQVKGKESDSRSDIYSIGIMMYEMLTGILPFTGDSAVNVAMKQVNETAKAPTEIVESIPKGIEQIVTKAMEKNPSDRYQSAYQMIADIKRYKADPAIIFPYGIQEEATKAIPVKTTNTKNKNTNSNKKINILGGILPKLAIVAFAVFIGSLVRIFMLFKTSGNALLSKQENVDLPNFVGMTVDEIKGMDYSFKYVIEELNNANYPKGEVYAQNPRPPKSVKEKGTIKLFVSLGPATEQLIDLSGYARSEAERYLSDLEVNVNIVMVDNKKVSANHIISTDPEQGTIITQGSTVTLYVSKGDAENTRTKVTVPNVVGLSKTDASKVLAANKLTLGAFVGEYSDAPAGTVIRQAPNPGEKTFAGGRVTIVVSDGPRPEPKCPLCDKVGHEEKDHICSICDQVGHEGGENCEYQCTICGKKGHLEENCPDKDKPKCDHCGKTDHTSENCPDVIVPTPNPDTNPTPVPDPVPSPSPAPTTTPDESTSQSPSTEGGQA